MRGSMYHGWKQLMAREVSKYLDLAICPGLMTGILAWTCHDQKVSVGLKENDIKGCGSRRVRLRVMRPPRPFVLEIWLPQSIFPSLFELQWTVSWQTMNARTLLATFPTRWQPRMMLPKTGNWMCNSCRTKVSSWVRFTSSQSSRRKPFYITTPIFYVNAGKEIQVLAFWNC